MLRDKFSVEILRRISPNEPPFKDCCCSHWGSSPIFVLKSYFVLTLWHLNLYAKIRNSKINFAWIYGPKMILCPSVLLSSNKISRKSLRTSKCRNSREERCHLVYYASNFGLVEFTRHPNINLSEPSFMSKQRNWTKWTTTLLVLLKEKSHIHEGENLSSLKHVGEIYRWNSNVWRKSVMAFMQSGHKNR